MIRVSTVSPVYGNQAQRLLALRAKDPDGSLVERWRLLTRERPDFRYRCGFVPLVVEVGWAVVWVRADGVAYTVGLHYRFGHKELLLVAPHLSAQAHKRLLNQLACRVRGGERFRAGQRVTFADRLSHVTFRQYEDHHFEKYPCSSLAHFEALFEDRDHRRAGTLPVLWGTLVQPTPN